MTEIRLIDIVKGEYFKFKKNSTYLLILLTPVILILGIGIYAVVDLNVDYHGNYLKNFFLRHVIQFVGLIYPILIALYCSFLCNIEFKGNNIRRLYTLPFRRIYLFLSKIIIIIYFVLSSILICLLLSLLFVEILKYKGSYLFLQYYNVNNIILFYFLRLFISMLAIAFIQFTISSLSSNYLYPLLFSSILVFISILINKEWTSYIPYKTDLIAKKFFIESTSFGVYEYSCIACIFLFLVMGYLIYQNKWIKS